MKPSEVKLRSFKIGKHIEINILRSPYKFFEAVFIIKAPNGSYYRSGEIKSNSRRGLMKRLRLHISKALDPNIEKVTKRVTAVDGTRLIGPDLPVLKRSNPNDQDLVVSIPDADTLSYSEAYKKLLKERGYK